MPDESLPRPQPTVHDLACLCISDLHALALERMDKQTRDYYNEGADDNSTLQENSAAYQRYRLRPRVLRDVSNVDTRKKIFGGYMNSVPFGVAPTAMQGLAHHDRELGTARACRDAGIVMGLSSFSTTSLEDVRAASGDNINVLQLYLFEDRAKSMKLIERAKKAGYKAVLLTVDTPILGRRNMEIRNQFKLPGHLKVANFVDDAVDENQAKEEMEADDEKQAKEDSSTSNAQPSPNTSRKRQPLPSKHTGQSNPAKKEGQSTPASAAGYHDGTKWISPTGPITFHTHAANPTLNWEESIPWLKKIASPMEVWVKGILTPEDALLAVEHGVDGIIVSNHGGRQLSSALTPLSALPDIVAAVNGRVPVHVDGGIRHGTDIFKAIALGADFCWIGRPVLWGLAYQGQKGVETCLRLLSEEVRLCMGLAGVTKVEGIGREYLVQVDGRGGVSKL